MTPPPEIIVISDLDGTLTTIESSWQFVLENLDLWENKGEKNLDWFLHGKITYDEFISLDVALLQGVSFSEYMEIISKIPIRGGLVDLFTFFRTLGIKSTIILSSGLKDVAIRISKIIPISKIYANEIYQSNNILNGKYAKIVGWHDKENIMKQIKIQNPASFIISLGDTSADVPLMKMADIGIACSTKSKVLTNSATFTVNNLLDAIENITEILNG